MTTLPPSCAVVTKSGNLNFLEPSGLLQASNGSDLPLPLPDMPTVITLPICSYNVYEVLLLFLHFQPQLLLSLSLSLLLPVFSVIIVKFTLTNAAAILTKLAKITVSLRDIRLLGSELLRKMCAAYSDNFLRTFRDNLSVPSSRFKKIGPMGCLETSVRNYHYTPCNFPEDGRSRHVNEYLVSS